MNARKGFRSTGLALALLVPTALASPVAIAAGLIVGAGSTVSVGVGSWNLGCNDVQIAGTLNLNQGVLVNVNNLTIQPTGVLNGDQGTIYYSGLFTNNGTFNEGESSIIRDGICRATSIPIMPPLATLLLGLALAGGAWRRFARARA